MAQERRFDLFPCSERTGWERVEPASCFPFQGEWEQRALDVIWWHSIRARGVADSLEILNVVQRDFSCETVERFLLHQADQSGFDFIVLSSAGRRIDCGASGGEVTRKVPLSDGSALFLCEQPLVR